MKHRILFFFIFVQMLSYNAVAQDFHLKHFDINQGLSNNSVMSIFQDAEGYMWVGTYDGLNRFDGYNFKVYRNTISDSTSLVSNTVYSIAGDSKNYLWVGGARGACRLNRTTDAFEQLFFTPYDKPGTKLKVSSEVHRVNNIAGKGMLVASKELGLLFYKEGTVTASQVPLLYNGKKIYNYDAVAAEYVPEEKVCWVAIRNYGICRLNPATMSLTLFYPFDQRVYCLMHDKDTKNQLWLGTGTGAYVLNLETSALSNNKMTGNHIVLDILRDASGAVWMATDGHGIYNAQNDSVLAVPYLLSGKKLLSKSNSFFCVYEDRQDNLWFGTLRAGINLLGHDPQRFSHILVNKNPETLLPDNFILSFCEGTGNDVWIGTDGAGLKHWDRDTNTFTQYSAGGKSNGLSSNFITGITRGNGNDLWISTWYGDVNRLDVKTGEIRHYDCYNPYARQIEKNTWLVFKDRNNKIWVSATNEGALYYFNDTKQAFEVFNKDIKNLQSLTQTNDGRLWGGDYNALYSIDINSRTFNKYELGYPVRAVKQDSKGNLWVGTQEGGLLLFNTKTGKYKRYTTADGLPGNVVLRILEDKTGNLWISTYNGLSRFDKKKTFRNFSVSDGLQGNQFSFNAGLLLSTGEMLFGGINGFNIFVPESIITAKHIDNLRLSGVWLNSKPLNDASPFVGQNTTGIKHLRLPYDQTALSFDFISLDFLHPDKIKYAYILEGWDDHWIYTDNLRKASYSHIREGEYTFKVKTLSGDGTWDAPVTLATVTVLPPWYRTWWSYILYGLLATGAIIAWVRYNRYKIGMAHKVELAQLERRKEKEMAERQTEMFTYITHEFRTPLSLIINPLRHAGSKPQGNDTGFNKELGVAHRNARRLLSLVDQLLLFRKAESDADELNISPIDVKHLCREVYECFVNLAKEQGIDFVFDVPESDVEIFGDYEKVEIALFNIASNAFKYTPQNGRIIIKVYEEDGKVAISISDNGSGIAAQEQPYIFSKFRRVGSKIGGKSGFGVGLFITKYFVEKHHATIVCDSIKGQGTTFTLRFLKGSAHFADLPVNAPVPKKSELVKELIGQDDHDAALEDDKAVIEKEILTEKKSVLIVEDNAEMRHYLEGLFSGSSVVYSADNGLAGYEMAQKHHPDIIISDISMEGMDGLELCRRIKSDNQLGHLPVILLTATTSQEIQLKGISEGADDFITKPFNSDILIAKVERLLKSRTNLKNYFLDNITLKDNGSKVPAEYREFLNKCIEIIEANFGNPDFNLKAFALEMGMSHRSLYDKIKQISGQTLNAFIRSVRLRRAALLMLTENKNIGQISSQVGFEDQRYFREQFVKLFGMTPSEYIKRYKHNFNKELNVIKDD